MEYRSPFKEKPCERKRTNCRNKFEKKGNMNNVFRRYNSVLE